MAQWKPITCGQLWNFLLVSMMSAVKVLDFGIFEVADFGLGMFNLHLLQ
jgi:hypothetical protein